MATILLILQLLPAIIKIVTDIEAIFKGLTVTGAVKKQVLMDALEGQDKKIIAVISSRADRVVKTFNDSGVFTHGVDLPPVDPPKAS